MPYSDHEKALAYYKRYNRRRTELVHKAKAELGIPLDMRRRKPEKPKPATTT